MARRKRNHGTTPSAQSTLPLHPTADERLDIAMLETWLWDAACAIRGATDAPKCKDHPAARVLQAAVRCVRLARCVAIIAALDREAALLDELFRALLEELMTGRLVTDG